MLKKKFLALCLFVMPLTSLGLEISSQDIKEGSRMSKQFEFNGFGCSGLNQSPELNWRKIPKGTKSFAITVYDPDAPTQSGFWHWVVTDIPANVTALKTGSSGQLKTGVERINDYGKKGFGGACPPRGDGMHRYQFTVWALPVEKLDVVESASNAVVSYMLNQMSLDHATLTATYVNE